MNGTITARPHASKTARPDMTDSTNRSYTDKEVALILRKAAELQDLGQSAATQHGLTLKNVEEIAREIGIDPGLIRRAAESLTESDDPAAGLLGGPVRRTMADSFNRELSEEERRDLIEVIRTVMKNQGKVGEVLGAVEWKAHELETSIAVTVTGKEDRTEVQIVTDRTTTALVSSVLPAILCTGAAGIVVDSIQPGLAGMLGILGGGLATGALVARSVWGVTTSRFNRRMAELRRAIARQMNKET